MPGVLQSSRTLACLLVRFIGLLLEIRPVCVEKVAEVQQQPPVHHLLLVVESPQASPKALTGFSP
jgi:hypothetical protein